MFPAMTASQVPHLERFFDARSQCIKPLNSRSHDKVYPMNLFHESLTRLLSGATLTGFLSPSGDQNPKAVSVLVKQLKKSGGSHDWRFQVLITPGGNGQVCSITADVHWAGETPVVSLHDVEILDTGLINGKVLIHNGLFAATWVYEGEKGQAWGEIVSQTTPHRQSGSSLSGAANFYGSGGREPIGRTIILKPHGTSTNRTAPASRQTNRPIPCFIPAEKWRLDT